MSLVEEKISKITLALLCEKVWVISENKKSFRSERQFFKIINLLQNIYTIPKDIVNIIFEYCVLFYDFIVKDGSLRIEVGNDYMMCEIFKQDIVDKIKYPNYNIYFNDQEIFNTKKLAGRYIRKKDSRIIDYLLSVIHMWPKEKILLNFKDSMTYKNSEEKYKDMYDMCSDGFINYFYIFNEKLASSEKQSSIVVSNNDFISEQFLLINFILTNVLYVPVINKTLHNDFGEIYQNYGNVGIFRTSDA